MVTSTREILLKYFLGASLKGQPADISDMEISKRQLFMGYTLVIIKIIQRR
jgi:hypothetical protein